MAAKKEEKKSESSLIYFLILITVFFCVFLFFDQKNAKKAAKNKPNNEINEVVNNNENNEENENEELNNKEENKENLNNSQENEKKENNEEEKLDNKEEIEEQMKINNYFSILLIPFAFLLCIVIFRKKINKINNLDENSTVGKILKGILSKNFFKFKPFNCFLFKFLYPLNLKINDSDKKKFNFNEEVKNFVAETKNLNEVFKNDDFETEKNMTLNLSFPECCSGLLLFFTILNIFLEILINLFLLSIYSFPFLMLTNGLKNFFKRFRLRYLITSPFLFFYHGNLLMKISSFLVFSLIIFFSIFIFFTQKEMLCKYLFKSLLFQAKEKDNEKYKINFKKGTFNNINP